MADIVHRNPRKGGKPRDHGVYATRSRKHEPISTDEESGELEKEVEVEAKNKNYWDESLEAEDEDEDWIEKEFGEEVEASLGVREKSSDDVPLRKYAFKLKQTENGNILTLHHTVTDGGQSVRIRFAACCFNDLSNQLIAIDKRGNVFIFDFVNKRYWRLSVQAPKVTLLRPSPIHRNNYIIGNKLGEISVLNVEDSTIICVRKVGSAAIEELSFGTRLQSLKASNTLLRFGREAALLNVQDLRISHELHIDHSHYMLKLASYLPSSDQFFTCFTNDSLHIWSTQTFNTLRVVQPIKARNRKQRLLASSEKIPEISLRSPEDSDLDSEVPFSCQDQDYADGFLLSYCFTPDGNKFCLSTLDGYLLMLSTASFDLEKIYRLQDFILKQMAFLPQPKERILFGITARGQAIMLDLVQIDCKVVLQGKNAACLSLSRDGKLLSVLSNCGEVNVWSTCRLYNTLHSQEHCLTLLRTALKKKKMLPICNVSGCMPEDLRNLLKHERLNAILNEYGSYPEKYRFVIWTTLLDLPCNGRDFQQLLKLGIPPIVNHHARRLQIRSDALRRAVAKVWSCLAQWCKVFAFADFMPHLVFPFVKHLPKNGLVAFELLVTLLLNHFQLWFEFHPLPPANYLAMIENLLQRNDTQLCKFYAALEVQSKDYAWSMLTNVFAEVLDEQQWLILWDNIITEPPYFPIFIVVAYNIINREVLLRLPDKKAVQDFFHDQNPIDVANLLAKARKLISKCDPTTHPKRFMQSFKPLPKNAYPKFLNYPTDWIGQQEEQSVLLMQQHQDIDARIRHLEFEEIKIMERLQNGLKEEEHTRRIKEMEQLYHNTLQREEERIQCQRKMLLLYQKEVRQRKGEVISQILESEQRRKALEMEKEIGALMHTVERERRRHNQEMLLAEDEIRNQEMELLAQRYYLETSGAPLAQKYYDNITRMCRQRDKLQKTLRELTLEKLDRPTESISTEISPGLIQIEQSILEIQRELTDIISES